jgi:carbonic anhydrase/acetyltransferase-like protein (isoleucine patch superfamily)
VSVRSGGAAAYMRMQSIDPQAWIAPSAQLFGKVAIGAGSSVWHNAVLRAECQEIRIGRMTNLQDFVMVHVGYDVGTRVGDFCTVAHHATVHGCTLGDDCLVGVGAVIMDGAEIGAGSIVAGGAVVPEGRSYPPCSVIAGVPARQIAERESARANRMNAWLYHRNAQFYRDGRHRAWDGPEYEAWRRAKQAEVDADRDLAGFR